MWHQSFIPAKNCHCSLFGLIILFDIGLHVLGQFYPHHQISNGGYWDYENGQQQNGFINSGHQFPQFPSSSQQMFGQWNPTQQQQYFQPHPPSFPPQKSAHSSNSFQLPYASYRGSAFSVPPSNPNGGIDQIQKERLAKIADESETFGSERARNGFFEPQKPQQFGNGFGGQGGSGADGIQRILASVAEKLPKIAETMARLSGGGKENDGISTLPKEKFVVEEFEGENQQQKGGGISLSRREYEIDGNQHQREGSQLINSMAEPASLFSFNKLLSAFGSAVSGQKVNGAQGGGDGTPLDLKGTPILKSEDLEPELILQQKSAKQEFFQPRGPKEQPNLGSQQPHLTPPPELPSQPQNPFNSFLQQFGIPNNFMATTTAKMPSSGPGVENEENGDLFGSLMKGKLPQMPDWLKQFGLDGMFGGNGTVKQGGGAEDAGNALAQLFGGGGKGGGKGGSGFGLGSVLGSGLDDMPRR